MRGTASKRARAAAGLLRQAWVEYKHDYASYFAGSIVYYALVSLVPLILLLLATLGLLLRFSDVAADLEQQVTAAVEANFGPDLRASIDELLQRLKDGSIAATLVSLLGLLVTASLLFRHLRMTFRAIWKFPPPVLSGTVLAALRAMISEILIAFSMVVAAGAILLTLLITIAALHALGSALFSRLPGADGTTDLALLLLSPAIMAPLTFALLYRFLPPVRLRWRDIWFGALFAGGAWLLGAEMLGLYATFMRSNRSAYGAFGAALLLMFWMYAISKVLFFGAELCKVVAARSERDTARISLSDGKLL
jgi:membrane protein